MKKTFITTICAFLILNAFSKNPINICLENYIAKNYIAFKVIPKIAEQEIPKVGEDAEYYLRIGRNEFPSIDVASKNQSKETINLLSKHCFFIYDPSNENMCRYLVIYDCNTYQIVSVSLYP